LNQLIPMNDLGAQYLRYKNEIDAAISSVIRSGQFINGPVVRRFEEQFSAFLGGAHVIACANGTDALQIALMALDLQPGDEVITTPFTFGATAEVIGLLKLKVVFVDIDQSTFCIDPAKIEAAITPRTRCIIPVHLFGTHADMDSMMAIAKKHDLYVIEDAAQSVGASYTSKNGDIFASGTMGHIGTTSFFPSKNLGCYGDGGALITRDQNLAERIRMIANHGSKKKYQHEIIGVNSRLDAIQAAILSVKLDHLRADVEARIAAAAIYNHLLSSRSYCVTPGHLPESTHSYHQYTIRLSDRNEAASRLKAAGVSSMVYYPFPLHKQPAFAFAEQQDSIFPECEQACREVLSLPIYPDITKEQIQKVVANI